MMKGWGVVSARLARQGKARQVGARSGLGAPSGCPDGRGDPGCG